MFTGDGGADAAPGRGKPVSCQFSPDAWHEFYEIKTSAIPRPDGGARPGRWQIIVISAVVGGLIVSVMTALLSVSQSVG